MKFPYERFTFEDLTKMTLSDFKKYFSKLNKYIKSQLVPPVLQEDVRYMNSLIEDAMQLSRFIFSIFFLSPSPFIISSLKINQNSAKKLIYFADLCLENSIDRLLVYMGDEIYSQRLTNTPFNFTEYAYSLEEQARLYIKNKND